MPYDTDDFESDVIQKSYTVPVLVDFWAAWCGPCKTLGPILEDLAQQNKGEWVLAKLDTEKHPSIAAQYSIKSIPNVKLFVDGQVSDEFVGALPKPQVAEWLRNSMPSKYRVQLDGAKALLAENNMAQAKELLESVLAAEPQNEQALILMAQSLLASDSEQALKTIEPINMGSKYFEKAQAIRTLQGMFQQISDPESLPEDNIKNTYLGAIRHARENSFEESLSGFIDVVHKNRDYDNDGARKTCIAIFNLLGEDHEITKRYRRVLASALF